MFRNASRSLFTDGSPEIAPAARQLSYLQGCSRVRRA